MSMSVISVPRNDREFVQQATRPIADVLGIQNNSYTALLDRDHQGISEMCREALEPIYVRKTYRDYSYSMLFAATLAAGAAGVLTFLKSGSYKTVLIGAAIGALCGLSYGWSRVYFAKEVDLKETEIRLKATTERNWLRSKQPQIKEKLKEAEGEIAEFVLEDFGKEENRDVVKTRDFLLLLKSYVESATGRFD